MVGNAWTEDEIILMVQTTQEVKNTYNQYRNQPKLQDGEDAERTLAAEVIRHMRASRSHSKVLVEMNSK